MRLLIVLIFLSLNLQGQNPLDLLDSFATFDDNEKFAKELIDNGFTLDWHQPENFERQLSKDHLKIGLIDGPGACKYIIMRSDDSAFKLLMSTYLLDEREDVLIKAEADGVRFLSMDDSDNQYFVYISHQGWYQAFFCNRSDTKVNVISSDF